MRKGSQGPRSCPPSPSDGGELGLAGLRGEEGALPHPADWPLALSALSLLSFCLFFLPRFSPRLLPRADISPGENATPQRSEYQILRLACVLGGQTCLTLLVSTSGAEAERAEQRAGALPPEAPRPALGARRLQLPVPPGSHSRAGVFAHPQTGETD